MGTNLGRDSLLCFAMAMPLVCGGCAGAILRVAALGEMGAVTRGAAMVGGEAAAARLALGRPAAFRGTLAMDSSAASRIVAGQRIAATPGEISTMRSLGIEHTSEAGQAFLRNMVATDSQLSTLALSDRTFAALRPGQRLYTSITSKGQTRAGWVSKTKEHTVVFNDGRRDLIRSELNGEEVRHYSLRSGRPELMGRTLRNGDGLSFDTWDVDAKMFRTTGYAEKNVYGAWDFYTTDGYRTGTLVVQPVAVTGTSALPQSSIAPIAVGTGAVLALAARFSPTTAPVNVDCRYISSGELQALECDRNLLRVLAEEGRRIGYTVVMVDESGRAIPTGPSKDPSFSVRTDVPTGLSRDPSFSVRTDIPSGSSSDPSFSIRTR